MAIGDVIARLSVVLGMDTALFEKGANLSEKRLAQMERRFTQLGDKISGLGQKLALGLTLPLTAFGASAFNAASDAAELQSAFDQTFKQMSATMNKWAEDTGNALGRSTQEMKRAANTFGIFFNTAVDPKKAAEMSQVFAKLAQDLGSFYNTDTQTAIEKLRSGLSGESEPLRDFGVFLTEANVKAKALELGLTGVGNELTEQEKILARYQLILEATKNAQGDVERTSSGTANQIRKAKAAFEELQVSIGTKLLPIITPLIEKLAAALDAFNRLSPAVQNTILVAGGLSAVFGPVLIGVGALVSALGPLVSVLVARIVPAFILFKLELAALAVAGGPAAVAMRVLAVALRGLLIATGVGLAITAVAGAVYLLTRRTNESIPATQAYSRALNTAQQTAKDAKVASDNLSSSMGKEREAALKAAMAQRELAAQRLKAAQARIIDAEATARASTAAAKLAADRTRVAANDPRLIPGIDRQGADFRSSQAQSNLKAAQAAVITLSTAKANLDKSIAAAMAPINLPSVNAQGVAGAADRAGGAVDRLGKSAAAAATPLRDLLDQLFPAEADMREAETNLGVLKKALDSGKISAERYSDAVVQLWRNFLGANGPPEEEQIQSVLGGETIQQISEGITNRFADAMDRLNDRAKTAKVQVVKTFKEMADETLAAFSRLADAIRGGGFLSILEAVASFGLQLGSAGLFGKSIQASLNKTPAFALGTSFAPGGLSLVGERGPELVDLPRGSRVTPNNELRRMGGDTYYLSGNLLTPEFWSQIQAGDVGAARAGAAGGVASLQKTARRRYG